MNPQYFYFSAPEVIFFYQYR